jgi:hypothetical protein
MNHVLKCSQDRCLSLRHPCWVPEHTHHLGELGKVGGRELLCFPFLFIVLNVAAFGGSVRLNKENRACVIYQAIH